MDNMSDMPGMTMASSSSTSMTMAMATSTATTAAAATATSMGGMDMGGMGGMDMGNGGVHSCKIEMLWNWDTIDACFISSSWHIKSKGMFAGSCIGVILLAITLEGLRRSVKEYDRFLIRKNVSATVAPVARSGSPKDDAPTAAATAGQSSSEAGPATVATSYRPKLWEQAIRALLHTVQFVVAYFLMLLAMYYNGYIIICIFIGAYIGSFVFQFEKLGGLQTTAANEATVCCG